MEPYTPEWAEPKKPASRPRTSSPWPGKWRRPKPQVVFHYGYRRAHHPNEIYLRRSLIILNALMGSPSKRQGRPLFQERPARPRAGGTSANTSSQELPKITAPRFDGSGGGTVPHRRRLPRQPPDAGPRHPERGPLPHQGPDRQPLRAPPVHPGQRRPARKALDKLDLIVAIDVNFSEIAWYADVILPESTYLERGDSIQAISGLKPQLYIRSQAVTPRYDTKPGWLDHQGAGPASGFGPVSSLTRPSRISGISSSRTLGVTIEDFDEKGFVVPDRSRPCGGTGRRTSSSRPPRGRSSW